MNIQLHADQLHNNNCLGIDCVLIPAPIKFSGLLPENPVRAPGALTKKNCHGIIFVAW